VDLLSHGSPPPRNPQPHEVVDFAVLEKHLYVLYGFSNVASSDCFISAMVRSAATFFVAKNDMK
jgi:hypothetical protein